MSKPKPRAIKVFDPEEGGTHYQGNTESGNVTLCGQTDWLAQKEPGYETDNPVDCYACLSIINFVNAHDFRS